MTVLKIKAYKTNLGYFVKQDVPGYYGSLSRYIVNGIELKTLKELPGNYYLIPDPITSLQELKSQGTKLVGYNLNNKTLASDKIPEFIPSTCAFVHPEDEWTDKYAGMDSLYSRQYEALPPVLADVSFEFEVVEEYHIENYNKPDDVKFSRVDGNFNTKANPVSLDSIVNYYELEKALYPEFLWHKRPCFLSSKQVYSIVRAHIKENHNPKFVRITSDYDFCFTVKRLVQIKPHTVKTEIYTARRKSYNPPKYKTSQVQTKEVEIFEMTWPGAGNNGQGYNNYTCIDPWKGNNLKELQENIKQYLDDLTEEINSEVHECQHCDGTGHIVSSKIGTNSRNAV